MDSCTTRVPVLGVGISLKIIIIHKSKKQVELICDGFRINYACATVKLAIKCREENSTGGVQSRIIRGAGFQLQKM